MTGIAREQTGFANWDGQIYEETITDDKGKVIKKYDVYMFPTLYYVDSAHRTRQWNVIIRLIKAVGNVNGKGNVSGKGNEEVEYPHDWEPDEYDDPVPIKKKYFTEDVEDGIWAQYWTEQGLTDGKISRHPPTIVKSGKNIGKTNYRNVFVQAMIEARSKYLANTENKGYSTKNPNAGAKVGDKADAKVGDNNLGNNVGNLGDHVKGNLGDQGDQNSDEDYKKSASATPWRLYPMALEKYEDHADKIHFPLYVQRKLDGLRVVFYNSPNGIDYWTRKLKNYPLKQHIKTDMEKLFKEIGTPNLYLDGEFYIHGDQLQTLSAKARNPDLGQDLEFHIFDVIDPTKKDFPFSERLKVLNKLIHIISNKKLSSIKVVDTYEVKDAKELNRYYRKFLDEKYEGAVLRNATSPHEYSFNREIRSYWSQKMKPGYTAEFNITGFTQGKKGKDVGAIIWELETDGKDGKDEQVVDGKPLGVKHKFTAVPKDATYPERKEMFKKMSTVEKNGKTFFENHILGKVKATIWFQDLSKSNKPLRPKFVSLRDFDG